jgi:quercetin dioxygenase-like cupin family protein
MRNLGLRVGAILLVACGVAWSQTPAGKTVTYVSSSTAVFKELASGASGATVWGDPNTGPHGAFTKFNPGFDAGVHSHTSDLRIVVIKGAYLYKADGKELRVGPGDFLFIPGGTKHWSGGDAKEGALFYQDGLGKFDIVPAK